MNIIGVTHAAVSSFPDPGSIVRDVYQFALMIGGLLAFGAIVFGAIKYTLAAGNPSGQHEGREWITQALLGLLLLVGATVVLRTINPELLSLQLPELTRLTLTPNVNPVLGGCASGQCASLAGKGIACKSAASCTADQRTVDKLSRVLTQMKAAGISFVVTEAYPPTVEHKEEAHNNGCAVDISVTEVNCQKVQSVINAMRESGGSALNEYLGCEGKRTQLRTADHIHFRGC